MTDRQMDKWTEFHFPLIDSTPQKGSSKKMQDVGSRKMCGGEPVSKQEMEYNH